MTNRYFYYLVIRHKGNVYLKKRTEKDIWRNLHDFPLIETKEKLSEKKLIQTKEWKSFFSNSKIVVNDFSDEVKHVLSHQKLFVRFVVVDVKEKLKGKKEWLYIKEKELSKYAVPVVMERFIKQL